MKIYIIDPSSQSIVLSKERFQLAVGGKKNIELITVKINEINEKIDIAIISTNSLVRAEMTRKLIKNTKVKNIIFEKFLFQKINDFDEINKLLTQRKIKAWVNQWMCSTIPFRKIINFISPINSATIEVTGKGFGLGCNAVHFIDILDFLSERKLDIFHKSSKLHKNIILSQRSGFLDVNGKMLFEDSNNNQLLINSLNQKKDGIIKFFFKSKSKSVQSTFQLGMMKAVFMISGKIVKKREYFVPPQSQMTNKIILDIINKNDCHLPIFNRSIIHHKLLINQLDKHIRKNSNWSGEGCPIT
jgi:hypothetical protein